MDIFCIDCKYRTEVSGLELTTVDLMTDEEYCSHPSNINILDLETHQLQECC